MIDGEPSLRQHAQIDNVVCVEQAGTANVAAQFAVETFRDAQIARCGSLIPQRRAMEWRYNNSLLYADTPLIA